MARRRAMYSNICPFCGAQHQVHTIYGCHLFRFELGIAPRNHNQCAGMMLYQTMDGLPAFLVGDLGNATGIYDTHISNLASLGRLNAHLPKLLSHCAGFCKIQLAAQCKISGFLACKQLIHDAKITFLCGLCKLVHIIIFMLQKFCILSQNNKPYNTKTMERIFKGTVTMNTGFRRDTTAGEAGHGRLEREST